MSFLKKVFFIFLFYLSIYFYFQISHAQEIKYKIEFERPFFYEGEEIEGSISLFNPTNVSKNLTIIENIGSNQAYVSPAPIIQHVQLKPYENKYLYFELENVKLSPGQYYLEIEILNKNEKITLKKSLEIKKPLIELYSCMDKFCRKKSSIFYTNEKICLNYKNLSPYNFSFFIQYPNGKSIEIRLPTCLKLKRGVYEIKATPNNLKLHGIQYSYKFGVENPIITATSTSKKKLANKKLVFKILLFVSVCLFLLLLYYYVQYGEKSWRAKQAFS